MKLILMEFGQETNTFSPDRIGFDKLSPGGWVKAETIINIFEGTTSYLGGAIEAMKEYGVQIVPIDSVRTTGGPLMTEECLEYCLNHICKEIKKAADDVCGIFLSMHGGGRTEAVDSLETYTLKRIREVVGDMPIMSPLDLHCNIPPELVEYSDGLFIIKESPHTDCAEAGYLAAKTLIRKLKGEIKPIMTMKNIPLLVSSSNTSTYYGPMKEIKEYLEAYCKEKNFIDVSFGHGFSANDTYWAGASIIITAERETKEEVDEVCGYIWSRRFDLDPQQLSAGEAIDMALAKVRDGYAVINESSDNPGSGCPGDGTHLLRELIDRNIENSVFMFMLDEEVAKRANKAGVGALIDIELGGKTTDLCGAPLALENVEVLNLSNGKFKYLAPMRYKMDEDMGLSCRLKYRNVEIVVVSKRMQTLDDRTLMVTGADIDDYKLICLKSANHFRGWFQDRADVIVNAETPGLRPSNLSLYPYKQVRRPIYPLDRDTVFAGSEV